MCSQKFHLKITESIQKKHKRGISLDRYVCRDVPLFSLYRKYRVTLKCESHDSYRAKSPSGGSHCGGMESCRLCDPPQAENPASQDSFLLKSVIIIKKHRKELSNLKEMRNDAKTIRTEAIQEVLPDQAVKGGRLAKACSDRQI